MGKICPNIRLWIGCVVILHNKEQWQLNASSDFIISRGATRWKTVNRGGWRDSFENARATHKKLKSKWEEKTCDSLYVYII
jgi:hypothetical protein